MEKFIDHCCEKCTHSKENPCKDFVRCCLEGPICHESKACADQRKAMVDRVALNEKFTVC